MATTRRRVVRRTKGAIGADNGVMMKNSVLIFVNAGVPSAGVSGTGAGSAGKGSICIDSTNGKAYINTNTTASPTWTVVGAQS